MSQVKSVDGVGIYIPMEGAKPFIGSVGKFEEVEEENLTSWVKYKI